MKSKLNIRSLKQRQLDYLKSLKDEIRDDDYTSRIYLDNSIEILESELTDEKVFVERLVINEEYFQTLQDLGIDELSSKILACFMTNNKPLSVKTICDGLNLERGKCYRVLNKYSDIGVLIKTSIGITRFHIRDLSEPFKALIEELEAKADKFRQFNNVKSSHP